MTMVKTFETMGERIRRLRERRGWLKADLARRAGVSEAYVGRLERDEYQSPGTEKLKQIADTLGETLESLTGRLPLRATPTVGRMKRTEDLDLPVYRAHAGRLDLVGQGEIDRFIIRANQTYVVEANGDCLFGRGINSGDRLLIDRAAKPIPKDIVVVRIGDDAFLAEWIGGAPGIQLRLSDDQLLELRYSEFELLGVAIDHVRPLRRRPAS